MEEERKTIGADCPFFACRVCRTKTGWPHQKWCELISVTAPRCGDCRYRGGPKEKCRHPAKGKGGGVR